MKVTIEGDGKGPVSRVYLPLVLPVTPPDPIVAHSLVILYYLIFCLLNFVSARTIKRHHHRFPGVCAVGGFRISQPSFSSGTW
jgi:hypothetical protein